MTLAARLRDLRQRLTLVQLGFSSVALIMTTTALVTFALGARHLPPWRYHGTLLALALLVALYALDDPLWKRQASLIRDRQVLAAASLLVLASNVLGRGDGFLPYLFFLVMGNSIAVLPTRLAIPYGLGIEALFFLFLHVVERVPWEELSEFMLSLSYGTLFTVIFTLLVLRYSEKNLHAEQLLAELRRTNAALEAAREREKELAVAEERLRLARDIHDGLGHHLTVLNVQLQAAAKLVERADGPRAAAAIATCKEVAQAALSEIRQSVAALRGTPLDGRSLDEALHRLVSTFDRHAPLVARFEVQGAPWPLPRAAAMTLYRAAQEGLTNAQKHAAARQVTVTLDYAPEAVTIAVQDDGTPSPPSGTSSGFGLAGLRERAEQLGGICEAGPAAGGGFRLALTVPVSLDLSQEAP